METHINKKHLLIKTGIVGICAAILFIAVYNDSGLYHQPIAKITQITQSGTTQTIQAVFKNGKNRGTVVRFKNQYDPSLVYDEKYRAGDFVFVDPGAKQITGPKRDYQVAAAILLLFSLLIILGSRQGLFTVAGLILSVLLFSLMLKLYMKGWDILGLSVIACIIFSFIVLILVSGWTRKMIIAFSATIGVSFIVGVLALILIWTAKNIGYDYLEFLPEPYTITLANHFFFATLLIGCLGAVMDITVTITACSTEMIRKTPEVTVRQLTQSMKEIIDDIAGTMINVVFFTNIAAVIPVFIVSMRNSVQLTTVLKYDAYFEITRFLIAGIAILVAVPVSVFASSMFLKKGKAK